MKIGTNNYNIVLIGEKNGIEENFDNYMNLIKRFNKNEKINVYLELSYSAGLYINSFLEGNEAFPLEDFIANYKNTMFGTKKFEQFLIELRDYYQKTSNKIKVYGIDMEFQSVITDKMLEYTTKNNLKKEYNAIMGNKISTRLAKNLDEDKFQDFREKLLGSNFEKFFKQRSKALCFMGALHTDTDSENQNFIKALNNKHRSVFSSEVMYLNSKRTIREDNEFKTIRVNDKYSKDDYSMYGSFGINRDDKGQGIQILSNCHHTKML